MLLRSSLLFAASFSLVSLACSSDPDGPSAPNPGSPGVQPSGNKSALAVTLEGTARVRSEPEGIDCPGTCEAQFPSGSRVKLVSAPAEGWRFKAWSGACEGEGDCEVLVDGAASVKGAYALVDARWDPSFGAGDCADAWGSAGEKLSPCDATPDDYVVVRKGKRNLALCNSGKLVKNMRVGLGFTPAGDKVQQGDGKTPEGIFFIPRVLPDSDYHLAFLLSYPSKEDAARAANEGIVSRQEADEIIEAHNACTEPAQSTGLGGAIEIHGEGSSKDWTAGCVAVENADVDMLWQAIGVNDTIVVLP